jgi:hypothetical protein
MQDNDIIQSIAQAMTVGFDRTSSWDRLDGTTQSLYLSGAAAVYDHLVDLGVIQVEYTETDEDDFFDPSVLDDDAQEGEPGKMQKFEPWMIEIDSMPLEDLLRMWRHDQAGRFVLGETKSEYIRAKIFDIQQTNMPEWQRASDIAGWDKPA